MGVSENIMICDERISEDRYGNFTVLFSNYNSLDEDDICEIFAEFGKYLSIRQSGNKCGIYFVTYETYDEAKRAVDGLENHPDVQLKVYRKKRRHNFNDSYNNNRWINGGYANYNAGQRYMNRWRSTNRHYNDHNYARQEYIANSENRELHESSVWNEMNDRSIDDDNDSTKKFVNDVGDYCETNELSEDEKSTSYTCSNIQQYLAMFNNTNNNIHESESIETIATTINTDDEQFVKSEEDEESLKIADEDDKASVSSAVREQEKEEDTTSIIQEIKASEVIVGNVDLRMNEAYLLHLFDKYEPIAISRLVPLPHGNVQYCYVYFKSQNDALKVERHFDNMCFAGRQLVVQRPRRLIAAYLDQL